MLNKFRKYVVILASPLIYLLTWIIPKKKDRMVFGEWFGTTLFDTPYHIFQSAKADGHDVYFITDLQHKQTDRRILNKFSLKGIYFQLTAKTFVCNVNMRDFLFFTISRRNNLIQCGHGAALKSDFQKKFGPIQKLKLIVRRNLFERYTHALSPHHRMFESTCAQWKVSPANIIKVPEARCDQLVCSPNERRSLKLKLGISDASEVFLYCPTHRQEGKDVTTILTALQNIEKALNVNHRDYVIIFRPHFYDLANDEIKNYDYGDIKLIESDYTTFELMKISDALITDYSGIIFDYFYLNKPTICYAPDYEDYIGRIRGLNFPLSDVFNSICFDELELFDTLNSKDLNNASIKINPAHGYQLGKLSHYTFKEIQKVLC